VIIEGMKGISRRNIYIVLEDLDFFWSLQEVLAVIELWNDGCSLSLIASQVKRFEDEIALLIISVNHHRRIFIPRDRDAIRHSSSVSLPNDFDVNISRFLSQLKNGYYMFEQNVSVDFIWCESKVLEFDELWKKGYHIADIQKRLKRKSIQDIALIAIDRCRKGFIEPRKEGLEGITNGCPIRRSTKTKQKDKTA
jgi:hypothetical protein